GQVMEERPFTACPLGSAYHLRSAGAGVFDFAPRCVKGDIGPVLASMATALCAGRAMPRGSALQRGT
ncbi:MAG: hypothetical protein AAF899_19950, partial [Pseudomonadota bacterium]